MGWTREELARRAQCSCGTIANLEKGRAAYASTLTKIGKVLGRRYTGLLLDQVNKTESEQSFLHSEPPPDMKPIGFDSEIPFNLFDETEDLVTLVKQLAQRLRISGRKIYVIEVLDGSIHVQLYLPRSAIFRVLMLFARRKLELRIRISAIHAPKEMALPLEIVANLQVVSEGDMVRVAMRQPKKDSRDS